MNTYLGLLPFLNSFIAAGLGVFTITRNPRHPANIGLALGFWALALIEAGGTLMLFADPAVSLLGMRMSIAGQAALPATWLVFSSTFARANYRETLSRWMPVTVLLALMGLFFALDVNSGYFVSLDPGGQESWFDLLTELDHHFTIGQVGKYFYIYLILGLVLNLVHLENTLRSSKGQKRRRIKYVIIGTGSILVFFIYLSSQILLIRSIDLQVIPMTSTAILISSIMIFVSIIRDKLLDVDIFISRHVIYNSFTVLAAGIYLFSVGLITHGITYFDIPFNYFLTTLFVFVSVLVLVLMLFSDTLRRKAQNFITRHFYRHKYEFKDKWMETIEKISSRRSAEAIVSTVSEILAETMGAKIVHIWLYDAKARAYVSKSTRLKTVYRSMNPTHPLIRHMHTDPFPFLLSGFGKESSRPKLLVQEIELLASATDAVLCAPLYANREVIGFILVGPDISGEPYSQDDFDLLKAIAAQAGVQMMNIRLTQDIMSMKEAEVLHKMSTFVMHDLKNLTNSLSLVSQNAKNHISNPEFQQEAVKTIDATVAKMKALIERLKNPDSGLVLKREEADIKGLLMKTISDMESRKGKGVAIIDQTGIIPLASIDTETIEMVFVNLLTNAFEAVGNSGVIKVASAVTGGYISLTFEDNGKGIPSEFMDKSLFMPFKTTKKNGFGVGLYQCKTIIEAHGGTIEARSVEGKGTVFTVRLPLIKKSMAVRRVNNG